MEIRIEAVEGCEMPSHSFVSVKLGEVLKQGRYEPSRGYVFPKAKARHYAKIDIFKHVGSQTVLVNPDAGCSARDIEITSNDPTVKNLRLRVDMMPSMDKMASKRSKSVVRDQAASYLEKHRIEERLSTSMKALLQSQPDDPIGFFCCSLQGIPHLSIPESQSHENLNSKPDQKLCNAAGDKTGRNASTVPGSSSVLAEPKRNIGRDSEEIDVNELRVRAADVLLGASQDGSLQGIIASSRSDHTKPSKHEGKDDAKLAALQDKACSTLASASRDGRLQSALAAIRSDASLSPAQQYGSSSHDALALTSNSTVASHKQVALGLAEAATAVASMNPVSAAGLAKAAAEVVESSKGVFGAKYSVAPDVVTGLAEMAVSAAMAGSETAPGLIEAAVVSVLHVAKASE